MKIENFARIVGGVIQNSPSIDAFEMITLQSHKVNRADLFIDTQASLVAIVEAIEKGAYAILSELDFLSFDEEIAWIKVNDISQALIKLLRYLSTEKSLFFVIANSIQASFLKREKRIKVLSQDLTMLVQEVCRAKTDEILCLEDATLAQRICPSAYTITNPLHVNIISKGLFLSSFSYKEHFFHEVKIPSLFVPDFLGALLFCQSHDIAYNVENLSFIDHFYPQFITNHIRKKEFGLSEQVLIFEEDTTLLEREISYLEHQNLLICLPQNSTLSFASEVKIWHYTQCEDFEALIHMDFVYALVLGKKEDFEPFLSRDFSTQLTLF